MGRVLLSLARKCKCIRGDYKAQVPIQRECKSTSSASNDTKPMCWNMDADRFHPDSIRVDANRHVPPRPANWQNRPAIEPIYHVGGPDCSHTLGWTAQMNSCFRNIWKNDPRAFWPEYGNFTPINAIFNRHSCLCRGGLTTYLRRIFADQNAGRAEKFRWIA